jgi:hypothetical protein
MRKQGEARMLGEIRRKWQCGVIEDIALFDAERSEAAEKT